MEFILHLPQEIDKNGALWQLWSSFCQNLKFFQITELEGTTELNSASMLLFSAHDQINAISAALKMYNLDLPQLNQILQVVEQACLPYFILLFERFKYFSLKHEATDNLDEFVVILKNQIEYCEFGNLKESMMTTALDSSIKSESLVQHMSNTDGINFDDITVTASEPQEAHFIVSAAEVGTPHIDTIATPVENVKRSSRVNKGKHRFLYPDEETGFFSSRSAERNVDVKKRSAKFQCCFCGTSFVDRISLGKHLALKHKKAKKFNCKICTCEFLSADDYLQHCVNEHSITQDQGIESSSKATARRDSKKLCLTPISKTNEGSNTKGLDSEKQQYGDEKQVLSNVKNEMVDIQLNVNAETFVDGDIKYNIVPANTEMSELMAKMHCCFCDKSFIGEVSLKKHLISNHQDKTNFNCIMCTEMFATVDEYLVHNRDLHFVKQQKLIAKTSIGTQVGRNIAKYDNSNYNAEGAWSLKEEQIEVKPDFAANESVIYFGGIVETHADDKTLISQSTSTVKTESEVMTMTKLHCCFCDRSFVGEVCLKKHFASSHQNETKFKCKMCSDEFSTVDEYLLHNKMEHYVKLQMPKMGPSLKKKVRRDIRKCCCAVCRGGLIKDGCLNNINVRTNSYLCWCCEESCPSLMEYKEHCSNHESIGRYTCDMCQMPHHNIFRLIGHLRKHFIPQNKCEICGVIFIKQESLIKHLNKHAAIPAHICEICGRHFVLESRLQSHMRIHTGEKRYTCELCGKSYANKNNLRDHNRWHAGEKPFVCDVCGKRTRSSGDMSKHKRKHLNKRAYVCEICGRGFNYRHILVRHRLGHSGKRSYGCQDCGRTFIYREGLSDHIKAQRCPGKQSEASYKRTPKAGKMVKRGISGGISANLMDVVGSEIFVQTHSQRNADNVLRDTQDWLCVLNNETEVATNILVVSSMY